MTDPSFFDPVVFKTSMTNARSFILAGLSLLPGFFLSTAVLAQDGVPDLVVNSIDVTPSSWQLGESIFIVAGVKNVGSDNSDSTTVDFFISTDATISTADQQIGSDSVIPLQPSAFWAAELSAEVQSPEGSYWIGACVQPDGLEQNTSNNCSDGFAVSVTVNSNACLDLPLSCGDNVSTALSSSDCDLSPAGPGHFAKTHTFEGIAGTTVSIDAQWTGDGYLYLEDPSGTVVAENDDTNDTDILASHIDFTLASSGTWKIWATTLEKQDTMNYEVKLLCSGQPTPDLALVSPAVSAAVLTPGSDLTFSVTVRNQGGAAAASTTLHYLLSPDAKVSLADTELGIDGIGPLPAGEKTTNNLFTSAPGLPGSYWLGACIDAVPGDSASGNDCSAAVKITVQAGEGIAINAAMNDAWYSPATEGQGFFFNVFPGLEQMFVGWFTFDVNRPSAGLTATVGEPGHRWLTPFGDITSKLASLVVYKTLGGVFNSELPEATEVPDGTFQVSFSDCGHGQVEFAIPSSGKNGVIPIERISNDNVPLCEELAGINTTGALRELQISPAQVGLNEPFTVSWDTEGATTCSPAFGVGGWNLAFVDAQDGSKMLSTPLAGLHIFDLTCNGADGAVTRRSRVLVTDPETAPLFQINEGLNDAWFNAATPGQGFFVNVFPGRKQVFLSWFTFETERPDDSVTALIGEPGHRWYTAFGEFEDNVAVLDLELTRGGIFNDAPPNANSKLDGTIRLEFSDCDNATVEFDINSADLHGSIPIRRITQDNVPLCEILGGSGITE